LELYRAIADGLAEEKLSAKFSYRLVELLQPYLTASTPFIELRRTIKPVEGFNASEVIRREFAHALDRQRGQAHPSGNERDEFCEQMTTTLNGYLNSLKDRPADQQLRALIGLCQTVAFARIRNSKDNAEPKGTP
jgi:hypothetical protein